METVIRTRHEFLEPQGAAPSIFRAALLLTGSCEGAERAVMEAIESLAWDELLTGQFAIHALTLAIRGNCASQEGHTPETEDLPPELQRILWLPRDLRYCFVLRILLRMNVGEVSRVTQLEAGAVQDNTIAAARALHAFTLSETGGDFDSICAGLQFA